MDITVIADKNHPQAGDPNIKCLDLTRLNESKDSFNYLCEDINNLLYDKYGILNSDENLEKFNKINRSFVYILPKSFNFDFEKFNNLIIPERTEFDVLQFNNLNKNTKFSKLVNCRYVTDYMKSYCSKCMADIAVNYHTFMTVLNGLYKSNLFVPGIMHLILARMIYDHAKAMLMVPGDFVSSNGNESSNVRLSESNLEFLMHMNQCLNLKYKGSLIDENIAFKLKDEIADAGYYRY